MSKALALLLIGSALVAMPAKVKTPADAYCADSGHTPLPYARLSTYQSGGEAYEVSAFVGQPGCFLVFQAISGSKAHPHVESVSIKRADALKAARFILKTFGEPEKP